MGIVGCRDLDFYWDVVSYRYDCVGNRGVQEWVRCSVKRGDGVSGE